MRYSGGNIEAKMFLLPQQFQSKVKFNPGKVKGWFHDNFKEFSSSKLVFLLKHIWTDYIPFMKLMTQWLIHWGLVMSDGLILFGKLWFRQWFDA